MVGRLVQGEYVGGCPQGAGHLQALLLSARERDVTPGPVVFDAELAAESHGRAVVGEREIGHIAWRLFCILGAIGGKEGRRDGAGIGSQDSACDQSERRLASAVVSDYTGPSLRERGGNAAQGRVCRGRIGIFDVEEVELHVASSLQETARSSKRCIDLRICGFGMAFKHTMLHPRHSRQRCRLVFGWI